MSTEVVTDGQVKAQVTGDLFAATGSVVCDSMRANLMQHDFHLYTWHICCTKDLAHEPFRGTVAA